MCQLFKMPIPWSYGKTVSDALKECLKDTKGTGKDVLTCISNKLGLNNEGRLSESDNEKVEKVENRIKALYDYYFSSKQGWTMESMLRKQTYLDSLSLKVNCLEKRLV